MARPMFCPWYPLLSAREKLPSSSGVFQIKLARGLLDYPRGKSAMVCYGGGTNMNETLHELEIQGPQRFCCRHLETHEKAPGTVLSEYLQRFNRRFGAHPSWPEL